MCVGEEKDGFFKLGDFIVHLELLDVRLEVRQVDDSTLAMGSCDDVFQDPRLYLVRLCPKAASTADIANP